MEKKENNYMTSGPDKFEVGAAIVVFVLFVLPTIVGACFMIWHFTKFCVTGKPLPDSPEEFYGLKKKDPEESKAELDRLLANLRKDQEDFELRHYGKVRERTPDPSDPEFFASYNRRGKEAK